MKDYQWVIHADADDIIVVDPTRNQSLSSFILSHKKDWLRCKAYEVLHRKDELDIDWSKPLLRQRKDWIRVSNLDKTALVRKDHGRWVQGNHYVNGWKGQKPTDGLYLIHLHRIDYKNYRKKYLRYSGAAKMFYRSMIPLRHQGQLRSSR